MKVKVGVEGVRVAVPLRGARGSFRRHGHGFSQLLQIGDESDDLPFGSNQALLRPQIARDLPVTMTMMKLEEARASGARAR